jgi:hypothetical protein
VEITTEPDAILTIPGGEVTAPEFALGERLIELLHGTGLDDEQRFDALKIGAILERQSVEHANLRACD